jgi:hypothetical protein
MKNFNNIWNALVYSIVMIAAIGLVIYCVIKQMGVITYAFDLIALLAAPPCGKALAHVFFIKPDK